MKKLLGLALLSITAFGVVGCGNNPDIPSLNEIKTQHYSEDKIERLINRVKRKNLIKEWGQPDRVIKDENEDVWVLDERRVLVVSYNIFNKVDDVDIED